MKQKLRQETIQESNGRTKVDRFITAFLANKKKTTNGYSMMTFTIEESTMTCIATTEMEPTDTLNNAMSETFTPN